MKNVFLKTLILVLILLMSGCTIYERTQYYQNSQKEISKDFDSKVIIKGYYDEPASIRDKNTIVLDGLSEGEFIEIVIKGEIVNFEHVRLMWNENQNSLEEIEILNTLDELVNQTIVIKTYIPEGIPFEKIKWQSISGENYEFLIVEDGESENLWEIILQ
jgi:hypothetical protein